VEMGYIAVSGRSIILKRDYDEKLSIRHGQS